ncbi:MAG: ATP-binding protein [Verrucomicrobiota bacterium]
MQLRIHTGKNGKQSTGKKDLPKTLPQWQGAGSQPNPMDEKVNILLVDDTPENLIALEAVLAELDQNIYKATSGAEALRLLLRKDFAAIILDVNMPGINGFETAALIRQRKNSEHTPIIFISAISTTEMHMYKGYALGAVDYIFTPVVPEVLRSKVAVFVELLKKTEEIKRQAQRLREIEEREHQRKLNEAAERVELETKRNRFFTLSVDLLGIADFEGRLIQMNPSWEKVLGYSESELQQMSGLDLVHPEDRLLMEDQLNRLKNGSAMASFEARYIRKNGGFRWLGWTAAPFMAEKLIYIFGRDITERKEAEEKIKKLNEALERRAGQLESANKELESEIQVRKKAEEALKDTNAELEAFCYSVSHDLRAPLRAMQAFAGALLDDCAEALGESGRDYAERIISAGSRMDILIQDLLLYSRVSHTDLQVQNLQMESVVQEALSQLEASLKESGAQVTVEPPFFEVLGHHATLVQIVCNLISNAIKFVAPGTRPEVQVRMERNQSIGRLWVEDNGIGIAPEHHHRIFRVFERLHGIETYPGTGIGLAIVRKGIERMGGRVGLESAPDRGSRFWVEIPLGIIDPECKPTEQTVSVS